MKNLDNLNFNVLSKKTLIQLNGGTNDKEIKILTSTTGPYNPIPPISDFNKDII